MSFIKYSLLGDIKRRINLECLRVQWHFRNKHNDTTIKNIFNINSVEVGNYTYGYLYVMSSNDCAKLKIGNFVSIASDVKFLLCSEHKLNTFSTFPISAKVFESGEDESFSKGDIIIDDDVWIGQNSIILSGIHVGQGAVIGAGSVVTKDVEPYTVVAGNPARVVKRRFSTEIIDNMMQVNYGDLSIDLLKKNKGKLMERIEDKGQVEWLLNH